MTYAPLELIAGRLIASVQAPAGSPVRDTEVIAALAGAALLGGASGLRLNSPDDIRRMRSSTSAPIIGLHKVWNGVRNIITPDVALAAGLAEAGADIIAVDATIEQLGESFALLGEIGEATARPVMADVSTFDEGMRAWEAGAAVIGTTLSGYTPYSVQQEGPDLRLVAELAAAGVPTIAEGRYQSPEQVRAAFDAGALAVVVGGAVTDPIAITRRFVAATPAVRSPA
ncbi:putative N-acetylmannosamine-6-phosphate 2-epimerase [Microbacterium sp. KSW4-16]|uniref:N-acetylmannosamine-6-phosphate 2-epimerase n=1 Tax=Microbacterium aurugineum TaxID=2851642 RepID=UPI0020BEDD5C|nr:putative N-acetylmannosamine-6-phosphate 2-epimerase [Microbacterium aurugineum]MCK8467457.1 putative N-acetylmannosamine-6-phosphate 2-epimerase [Microbacterium aurugineum]